MIFLLASGVFVTDGLIFHCHFVISSWLYIGNIYECEARVQNDGMETILNNVTGVHVGARTNFHIRGLTVLDQFTQRIPKNINATEFFPHIMAVLWQNSYLQTISAEDLEQFPLLEVISIHQNQVTTLDGNLFMHNGLLKSIGFRYNDLRAVGNDLLSNLPALQVVNFQDNPCVNHRANTTETIADLNTNLPVMCPMPPTEPPTAPPVTTEMTTVETTTSTTTTSTPQTGECTGECLNLVQSMNATISQLLDKISNLEGLLDYCIMPAA